MWYLLRHGKTIHNLKKLVQGWNTSFLCLEGMEQSKTVSGKLLNCGQDFSGYRLISSPAVRARQTMAIVQESLGLLDKDVVVDDLILPRNSGQYIDKPLSIFSVPQCDLSPKEYWTAKDDDFSGESAQDVYDRAIKFFEKWKDEENLIIVSYWEIMVALKSAILNIDKNLAKETPFRSDTYAVWNREDNNFEIF